MTRKYIKKTNTKRLKDKLDKLTSEYIRKKENGICYTCNKRADWKEMDAGHYIKRGCWRLRFDERNVHCQCQRCNSFMGGNMDKYAVCLERDYGQDILQELNRLRDMPIKKWKVAELEELVSYYSEALKTS